MTTLLTEKTTREFTVGIYREGKRLLVRKFELVEGSQVQRAETYVLDIKSAVTTQSQWVNQIHGYTLN